MAPSDLELSALEQAAARCLVQAGALRRQLEISKQANGHAAGVEAPPADADLTKLKASMFEAAQSLMELATPPEYMLTQALSASIMDLVVLRYINRFAIAQFVPTDKSISYAHLAEKAGVNSWQVKRILRYAMTKKIFAQNAEGEVVHSAASRLLLEKRIGILSKYSSDRGWPIATRFNEAIDKWGHGSEEPNQTAFNVFKDTDLAMFDYQELHPEYSAQFAAVMQNMMSAPPMSRVHIKSAFNWSKLSHTTVVDVGGSLGHGSIAILEANPTITCIVQDLAKPVAQATDPSTSIVPAHMAKRISFQEHSFWDPQPVSADIYFLRMIFHDWPDKYAKKILQALLVAMRPGSKLLIMDYVTLAPGTIRTIDERRMRMRDIQMMIMHNAMERDEDEWKKLLSETDPRLKVESINTPPGSALSIIEVVLTE